MTEPRGRGRPRSTGDRECGRCHNLVPKIRAHWPEGPICGPCFTTAARTYGQCAFCGAERLLPGRSPTGQDICRDCAGITTILADLRADGEQVSRKTVAASLRRQGLAGISPRRFAPATTVVDPAAAVPKDLVRRRFDTGVLNRVWTSDITYLGTGEGWLYLCAVRDGCSRRVIGWAIDEHMHTDLVQAALEMAVAMRGALAEQVILHADYVEVCVKPRICGDDLYWWGLLADFSA